MRGISGAGPMIFSFCRASGLHHTRIMVTASLNAWCGMQIREAKPGAISTYSLSPFLYLFPSRLRLHVVAFGSIYLVLNTARRYII